MNFGGPPPRKGGKKKKGKLKPEDVAEESPELAEFLRQRRKAEARMKDGGELDFYLVMVFQSEKQKYEFLENLPGEDIDQVNVLHGMYIDGESLARALGMKEVTPNEFGPLQSPLNKRLVARTGIPDQGTDKIGDAFWGGFG